jgi:predicted transcriptional regulator of viral defense system
VLEQNMTPFELNEALAGMPYVTKQNLGVLLGVTAATLDYRVRRLQATGALIPLRSGLYANGSMWQQVQAQLGQSALYAESMAGVLRTPSYVSLEYVLANAGIIPESPFAITCVTIKTPRTYRTRVATFIYRSMKPELFNGYKTVAYRGVEIRKATVAKALFDTIYLRPFRTANDMRTYLLEGGRFNWDAVSAGERGRFATTVRRAGSPKMTRAMSILAKEGIL